MSIIQILLLVILFICVSAMVVLIGHFVIDVLRIAGFLVPDISDKVIVEGLNGYYLVGYRHYEYTNYPSIEAYMITDFNVIGKKFRYYKHKWTLEYREVPLFNADTFGSREEKIAKRIARLELAEHEINKQEQSFKDRLNKLDTTKGSKRMVIDV